MVTPAPHATEESATDGDVPVTRVKEHLRKRSQQEDPTTMDDNHGDDNIHESTLHSSYEPRESRLRLTAPQEERTALIEDSFPPNTMVLTKKEKQLSSSWPPSISVGFV